VIDPEFLLESHDQRVALIRNLGFANARTTEIKLRLLVNECIGGIRDAVRDLPEPTRYDGSHESAAVKSPSQRFRDIEQELSELVDWFGGGRKPRLRPAISNHAIAAMLGLAPFGWTIIAATRHHVISENNANGGISGGAILRRETPHFFDVLSKQPEIAQSQIELYSGLQTEQGEPLYLQVESLTTEWPAKFLGLVDRQQLGHIPFGDLDDALSRADYPSMYRGTSQTLSMVKHLRSDFDRRSHATVEKWARCEPGFNLISAMLDEVWPWSKGIPPDTNRLGQTRAEGLRSPRQLLNDLANNLVDLVQEKINSEEQFQDQQYLVLKSPNHFLGNDKTYDDQVSDLLALIIELRKEATAYSVARHTIGDICEAVFEHNCDDEMISAANCVSEAIMTRIDYRLAARRQFLKFGDDHLRRRTFKWFGRLDPRARQHWKGETALAGAIYPVPDLDQNRHLKLYNDLVVTLDLDLEGSRAWIKLATWAGGDGREFWQVVVPDEIFRPVGRVDPVFLG
jgi:hypothetical protein